MLGIIAADIHIGARVRNDFATLLQRWALPAAIVCVVLLERITPVLARLGAVFGVPQTIGMHSRSAPPHAQSVDTPHPVVSV